MGVTTPFVLLLIIKIIVIFQVALEAEDLDSPVSAVAWSEDGEAFALGSADHHRPSYHHDYHLPHHHHHHLPPIFLARSLIKPVIYFLNVRA